MTERLYYKDPGLLEFDATIIATEQSKDKFVTTLDKTAFYPTSGGQPHDIGQLQTAEVTEVTVDDSGTINHLTLQPVGKPGDRVHGTINFERRQHFRQLHTAQHVLSRSFINLFNLETASVHLGEEYGAVELDSGSLSSEQSAQAEQFSNEIIQKNLPIEIIFADDKKAALLPLRKKPERTGIIRIIKIGELDNSACGGTHCNSTAEVILLKIIGTEKQRGHSLVKFLAGKKAVEDYNHRFSVTDQLTKNLTCSLFDIPDRFNKLNENNRELRRQLANLQKQLLPSMLESLSNKSTPLGKTSFVFSYISDIDPKLLIQLAAELALKINGVAALLLENRLCIAASPESNLDSGSIVNQLATKFSLKGGGNKNLAQLGGVDPNKIEEYKTEIMAILNAL